LLQLLARTLPTSPIPLRWLLPHRRLRCPHMAWFRTQQSRLPLLSSLGQRRLLIITHQSHPRCSSLRRMASDRRCLPRGLSCRAQRAHRYGAAGIAVAIGSRAACRLPTATTAPISLPVRRFTPAPTHRRLASATTVPIGRPAHRSTPAPMHRRLASALSDRMRLSPTQVQPVPMRELPAPTANKFGLIQLALEQHCIIAVPIVAGGNVYWCNVVMVAWRLAAAPELARCCTISTEVETWTQAPTTLSTEVVASSLSRILCDGREECPAIRTP
jgi:hypothetical protein